MITPSLKLAAMLEASSGSLMRFQIGDMLQKIHDDKLISKQQPDAKINENSSEAVSEPEVS